ncbi:MAG: EMC3/TMCO1 family protein [Thermoplasmata archaeon]|nr:EMC3/TMCO1 family protein [Thermoplasmata archaeon]
MIFLGLLAIYAIISPDVGTAFAAIANVVLFPAFGFGGTLPVLTILLAGILTTTVSSVIRDFYTNWVKMARTQKVMGAWRKEHMEAVRKGQTTKLEKLKEAQQAFLKDSMEMQTTPLKSTAWTMFLFIVIFTWLRLFVDVVLQGLGNQWIAVPWSNHVYLNSVVVLPAWVLLYSLLAIPIGQILIRVLKYLRFKKRLEAMGPPLPAGPDQAA